MSQVLIQQYLNNLRDLRKVSGTTRESVVREAFKDLLKGWARSKTTPNEPGTHPTIPQQPARPAQGFGHDPRIRSS